MKYGFKSPNFVAALSGFRTPLCRLRSFGSIFLSIAIFLHGIPLVENSSALAQSFAIGYKKYTKGDFKGAEDALQKALPQAKSPAERAKILKFLGISQYTRGDKNGAAESFRGALTAQPSLTISPDEVLDESVIAFFKKQSGSSPKGASTAKRGGSGSTATAGGAGKSDSNKPRFGKPTKSTWVIINSNAKGATIMMDGIMAGQTGDKIEVNGGLIKLTLQAPGFHSKTFNVKVHENRENNLTLNLVKIEPKKKDPPPAPVAARSGAKGEARKVKDDMFEEKEPQYKDEVQGRDLRKEFDAETGQGIPQQPGVGQPQYPGVAAPYPTAPAPVYQAPPVVAVPAPVYTMPQQYAAPYPQYPQQAYPQQAYPQQGYPAYQQPYPQGANPYGSMPSQNPYGAPATPAPTVEPPPAAPDYFKDGDDEEDAPPEPKAPRISKKKKKKEKTKDSSGGSRNLLITLLPFGAGQFQNGSPMLGAGLAVGEIFGIYTYYDKNKKADAYTATASAQLAQMDQDGNYDEDQKANYETQSLAYITKLRQQGDIGLYTFVVLWGAGVTEAFLDAPQPVKKKSKRKAEIIQPLNQAYASEDQYFLDRPEVQPYNLKIGPVLTPDDIDHPVKFGLILNHKF